MLKIVLLFKKFTNFMGKLTRAFLGFRMQNCQDISAPLKCDFFQIDQ